MFCNSMQPMRCLSVDVVSLYMILDQVFLPNIRVRIIYMAMAWISALLFIVAAYCYQFYLIIIATILTQLRLICRLMEF